MRAPGDPSETEFLRAHCIRAIAFFRPRGVPPTPPPAPHATHRTQSRSIAAHPRECVPPAAAARRALVTPLRIWRAFPRRMGGIKPRLDAWVGAGEARKRGGREENLPRLHAEAASAVPPAEWERGSGRRAALWGLLWGLSTGRFSGEEERWRGAPRCRLRSRPCLRGGVPRTERRESETGQGGGPRAADRPAVGRLAFCVVAAMLAVRNAVRHWFVVPSIPAIHSFIPVSRRAAARLLCFWTC